MAQHELANIGFKLVQVFKEQTLGIGSYGKVCKAQCDDLVCAAKLIHETLFDPLAQQQVAPQREHRLPLRRFRQECEFLSTIRHPNIILYLGMHEDCDTGLPVLLMELMDESLTHFLESSLQLIPYHIQVNICNDIALALAFLHSNKIIHRDLSGNNVLLRGNVLAKVTDFGMARLGDVNPHATRFTITTCPGTDVYMPPEAVKDKAVYTEKIDCFSFGVITLQILTQLFPKPGDRMQEIQLNHPGLPSGKVMVQTPEVDRRQNHISKVDPNHPLLPVVLNCLKENERDRPSAEQLCERTASLKASAQYSDARDSTSSDCRDEQSQGSLEADRLLQDSLEDRDHNLCHKDSIIAAGDQQLRQCREEIRHLNQENQHLNQDNQRLNVDNEHLNQDNQRLNQDNQRLNQENQRLNQYIQRLEREKNRVIQEKERQLGCVSSKLRESESVITDFQRRLDELEGQHSQKHQSQTQRRGDRRRASSMTEINLSWRDGEKTLCEMDRYCDAVVSRGVVYYRQYSMGKDDTIHSYHITTSKWSQIPQCPVYGGFALAVIDGTLTTIGGHGEDGKETNKLFSLTGAGADGGKSWIEDFPPMPTKRYCVSALCTQTTLVIVGGEKGDGGVVLKTVEILNTSTRQWYTSTELPQPLANSSITICGDRIYLLGGDDEDDKCTQSVYSCSLSTLLMPQRNRIARTLSRSSTKNAWTREADLPVRRSAAVSIYGQLVSVGGEDSNRRPTSNVCRYNPLDNSWEIISHMATPRSGCFAAVLPTNQLMVVGGRDNDYEIMNSVEFGTLEIC